MFMKKLALRLALGTTILAASPVPGSPARPVFAKRAPVAERSSRPPSPRLSLKDFLRSMYTRHREKIHARFDATYARAREQGLPDDPADKERFMQTMLVFSLVKSHGVLGNAWELVNDYPPADRRWPLAMVREAFIASENPSFSAGAGCQFYSHGRCDRLEMEFDAFLSAFAIPNRIFTVAPNHVKSAVRIGGHYLVLDNSFGTFALVAQAPPDEKLVERYDIRRTNRLADGQAPDVRRFIIDPAAAARVERAIVGYMETGEAPGWCIPSPSK